MLTQTEFEARLRAGLTQERADLQSLQGANEAQLSQWLEHICRKYLGYEHWKELTKESHVQLGSKGSKQFFPDIRINVPDNGHIFIEAKRLGRFDGPKGLDEINDALAQLKTYIRAFMDQAAVKPKPVYGIVTDGNVWVLIGLNRTMEFLVKDKWTFLTDDPSLLVRRFWLLAKPSLAQPVSAIFEFDARRALVEVLLERAKSIAKQVNEKLPDGEVTAEMIAGWMREAFAENFSAPVPPLAGGAIMAAAAQTAAPIETPLPTPPQKDRPATDAAKDKTEEEDDSPERDSELSDADKASIAEQLKPLTDLLPGINIKMGPFRITLRYGRTVVAIVQRRREAIGVVRIHAPKPLPAYAQQDLKFAAWCSIRDWRDNLADVAKLISESTTRMQEDVARGLDPMRKVGLAPMDD